MNINKVGMLFHVQVLPEAIIITDLVPFVKIGMQKEINSLVVDPRSEGSGCFTLGAYRVKFSLLCNSAQTYRRGKPH